MFAFRHRDVIQELECLRLLNGRSHAAGTLEACNAHVRSCLDRLNETPGLWNEGRESSLVFDGAAVDSKAQDLVESGPSRPKLVHYVWSDHVVVSTRQAPVVLRDLNRAAEGRAIEIVRTAVAGQQLVLSRLVGEAGEYLLFRGQVVIEAQVALITLNRRREILYV